MYHHSYHSKVVPRRAGEVRRSEVTTSPSTTRLCIREEAALCRLTVPQTGSGGRLRLHLPLRTDSRGERRAKAGDMQNSCSTTTTRTAAALHRPSPHEDRNSRGNPKCARGNCDMMVLSNV